MRKLSDVITNPKQRVEITARMCKLSQVVHGSVGMHPAYKAPMSQCLEIPDKGDFVILSYSVPTGTDEMGNPTFTVEQEIIRPRATTKRGRRK